MENRPAILIVDDSQAARRQIVNILEKAELFREFHEASNGQDGFKIILSQRIDLVLCDLEMPGIDGFKFLSMMQSRDDLRSIPVIMLTVHENREAKIRGLEQGASDYVTKPFDAGELVARVKVHLKIKSLQDSLKKSSSTDPLTDLANRRTLMEVLGREFNRCQRGKGSFSLIMMDIDNFKKINDSCGHQQGDAVLVAMADLLRAQLRQYDLPARFGGEEFALVLPDTGVAQAQQVAERLRRALTKLPFRESCIPNFTASFGIAACPHPRIQSVDDLIREADDALYRAKHMGRNRVEVSPG